MMHGAREMFLQVFLLRLFRRRDAGARQAERLAPGPSRAHTVTRKVKTAFGSMYLHIELNGRGQPVGGAISDPRKERDSQIAGLIEGLSGGLDAALSIGPGSAGGSAEASERGGEG